MSEFLDSERDGKKAAKTFNVDEEALHKKDKEAREEYRGQKKPRRNLLRQENSPKRKKHFALEERHLEQCLCSCLLIL